MPLRHKSVFSLFGVVFITSTVMAGCGGATSTATPAAASTPAPQTAVPTVAAPAATPTPATTSTPVPPPAAPVPKYGGIVQARARFDSPSWDTYNVLGGYSTFFLQQPLSNLVRFKKDSLSVIERDTAESWELGGDGKSYTFRLAKNIAWHDGNPFTSADVIYNLRRASDPKFTWNKDRMAAIGTVEAPDAYTVRVHLQRVSAAFLPNLAGPFMLMYPAHVTDMAEWQKSPVGTGAFVFKEYHKGESYTLRSNPNYFGKDSAGRRLPYLDGIDYRVIVDIALGLSAFRTGRLNCGCGYDEDFTTPAVETLKKEINGLQLRWIYTGSWVLMFNLQRPPFSNLAFRQAVAIGFDKAKIGSVNYGGTGYYPTPPLFPPELGGQWGLPKEELTKIPGYNPDHSVDLAIARQKFQESGIDPKSVALKLVSGTGISTNEATATAVGDVGVKVSLVELTSALSTQTLQRGDFDVTSFSTGGSIDDPSDRFSEALVVGGASNFGKYRNDRLDQLLGQQDGELDSGKRRSMLWEAQRIILTEFPFAPFLNVGIARAAWPQLKNFTAGPTSVAGFRLEEAWLEQ